MEENKKKYCGKCGKELELSAKFCKACGASQEINQQQQLQPEEKLPEPQKKSKLPLVGVGLASCFALSAVLFTSFFGKEETPVVTPELTLPVSEPVIQTIVPQIDETTVEMPEETAPEVLFDEIPEEFPESSPFKGIDMSNIERKQLSPSYATASSVLPNWGSYTYVANNVLDNNENTAWVENAPELGIGEWVEVHFDSEPVQEIQFYNGYGDNYDNNGVLGEVAISLSEGETFVYSVGDRWNTLVLPYALESSSVRLTILSSTTGKDLDTCISEVKVFNKSEEMATQLWDSEQIHMNTESYGDVSGLSSQQAQAFAQAIRQEREIHTLMMSDYLQWLREVENEKYYVDYDFTATLFSAGNGIPGLLVKRAGEIERGEPSIVKQVYLWDGKSAYRYSTGHEYEDFGMFYCLGVTKIDNEYHLAIQNSMIGFTGGDIGTGGISGIMAIPLKNGREVETLEGTTFEILISSSAFTSEYENPVELIDSISESKVLKDVDFVSFKDKVLNTEYKVETWAYISHLFVDGKYKGAYWTEYDVETNENVFMSPDGIAEADLPEVMWEMPEYTDENVATPKIDGLRFAALLDGFASSI